MSSEVLLGVEHHDIQRIQHRVEAEDFFDACYLLTTQGWIRDCPKDDLLWAKKRFIESFIAWNELERNQFLLPDGELKTLIAGAAEKLLPGAKP